MSLPREVGAYRIIKPAELTTEQIAILRRAGEERVVERLTAPMGNMTISASGAQRFYAAFARAMRAEELQ